MSIRRTPAFLKHQGKVGPVPAQAFPDLRDAQRQLAEYAARIGVLERENMQLRLWADTLCNRIHLLETRE